MSTVTLCLCWSGPDAGRSAAPAALATAVRTVGGSRHVASFAAAFYTFSPLRDSLSTLLDPANCRRCMLPCTGYPRRARAAARSATDARPRTTTAHEWSRRLTANRAVHVPLLETARRSWNGAGNVPVGTIRIGNVPGRPPGNQPASLSFARRVETADLVFALKRYYVLNDY